MSDDIVENLKQPSHWKRIGFMLAFAIALYVAGFVLSLLIVAQVVFSLLTGSDNQNLRDLGRDLVIYVKQVLDFLTYNSEVKPFPFSAYPEGESKIVASVKTGTAEPKSTVDSSVEPISDNLDQGSAGADKPQE